MMSIHTGQEKYEADVLAAFEDMWTGLIFR